MGSFLKRRVEPRAASRYYYSGGGYKQATSSGVAVARADQLYRVELTPIGPKVVTKPPQPSREEKVAHVQLHNPSDSGGSETSHAFRVIKDFENMVNRLRSCGEVTLSPNDSRKPSFPTICQVIYTFTPSGRTTDFEKNLTALLISWKDNFHKVVKESSSGGYSMDNKKLGQALKLIGCNISKPDEVDKLMSMFHTSDGRRMSYDEFIRCCAFVKGYLVKDSSSASARNLLTTSSTSPSTTSSSTTSSANLQSISSTSSPTTPTTTTSGSSSIDRRAKT